MKMIIACLFILISITSLTALASKDEKLDKVANNIETYFTTLNNQKKFNGVILFGHGNKVIQHITFGKSDFQTGEILLKNDTFKIGSVTKSFTSMAILTLVQEKKISLNDNLSRFIQGANYCNKITIHHLLAHTSGLPRENSSDFSPVPTLKDVIDSHLQLTLQNVPGLKYNYSNVGYDLLSRVVEVVSGVSYDKFLKINIFDKLAMNNTGLTGSESNEIKLISGYKYEKEEERYQEVEDNADWAYGSGGMYSNATDLFKWLNSFEKILSPQMIIKMTQKHSDKNYGYGIGVKKIGDITVLGHAGAIGAFRSYYIKIPELNLSVVVLANVVPYPIVHIAKNLPLIILDKPFELPTDITSRQEIGVSTDILRKYIGKYQLDLDPNIILEFALKGDRLYLSQGTAMTLLKAETESTFFISPKSIVTVSFKADEHGNVDHLFFLNEDGMDLRLTKIY